jgi:Cellulase (glycosyl hydrolase family 5)
VSRRRGLASRVMGIAGLRPYLLVVTCFLAVGCGDDPTPAGGPSVRVHPENPRYLEVNGEPTALITSGEHYGAVINADFDYDRYLDELEEHQFNLTRVFAGSFFEPPEKFPTLGHANTLAPRPGRFVEPWPRATGGKFDLADWNPLYFERLRDFVAEAGKRGIVVELTLFSTLYDLPGWEASPFHPDNNVNGELVGRDLGAIHADRVYTLDNGELLEFQEAFVTKHVDELGSSPNVYYEVINEPWLPPSPASDEWQDHIIETIRKADSNSAHRHLIARNYQQGVGPIEDPHPDVSIFNFHYERDPGIYRDLDGVVSFDETGGETGIEDGPYRFDAWYFMLSGGGIYDNLDWSFTPEHEDGAFTVPDRTPGGGGESLRRSLSVLLDFLGRFDLAAMTPSHELIRRAPPGATTRVLADPGIAYAIYVSGGEPASLTLELDPGQYQATWIDPLDGETLKEERLDHDAGDRKLTPPAFEAEIALAIERF